jgi:serine/threonine protein kinase
VIHRDLKPSNIFVTAPGVKVVDFGVATVLDPPVDPGATLMALACSSARRSTLLVALGRDEDALAVSSAGRGPIRCVSHAERMLDRDAGCAGGQRREALEALAPFDRTTFTDGEGLFYAAEISARLAEPERAIATLEHAVAAGWTTLIGRARERQEAVARAFKASGGRPLLGLAPA